MLSFSHRHSILGPAAPELGWVPTPRYLMRRARVLHMLDMLPTGYLLEVGPGAGAILIEASLRGFQCMAFEISVEARALARAMFFKYCQAIPIHATPDPNWDSSFDVLLSFEVLEHIENDLETLQMWRSWLKPSGQLLISVPAHARMWTAGDIWAGHVRRYERRQLLTLLQKAGFGVKDLQCYGFPVTNISELLGAYSYAHRINKRVEVNKGTRARNTDLSGIDRGPHLQFYPVLNSAPGKLALRALFAIQGIFKRTELGTGYLVSAQRI